MKFTEDNPWKTLGKYPVKKVETTRLPGQYLEHRDMDRMTSTVRVFARAKPEDKLDAGRCYAVFVFSAFFRGVEWFWTSAFS